MRKPDKLERQLKGVKKVYLDTACFIYHYGKHPLFQPASTEVLLLVEEGKLQGITSVLSVSEVLYRRLQKKPEEPLEYQRTLLGIQNLSLMFVDLDVAEKAAEIRLRYKLKTLTPSTTPPHWCIVVMSLLLMTRSSKKSRKFPFSLSKICSPHNLQVC
jgi:hypothetical protein